MMTELKKRTRKGGNAKANPHANQICKVLTKWWEPNHPIDRLTGLLVRKTEQSGANWKKGGEHGDITNRGDAMGLFFDRFVIELKRGYSSQWTFADVIKKGDKSVLWQFWQQVENTAEFVSKVPMLIFKPDHWPDILVMYKVQMEELFLAPVPYFDCAIRGGIIGKEITLCSFDAFLKINSSKAWK